jgi:23S rRNA pseudouridine1911/1915/1917 synthase
MFRYSGLEKDFHETVRPGIVHRLDKDTSGVIIAAKNPSSHEFLSLQFRKKRVKKKYLAIVKGNPAPSAGIIEKSLSRDPHNRKRFKCTDTGGKTACTEYKTLCRLDKYSFLVLKPRTGRTHQLRVHMLSLRTPILGDPLYSRKNPDGPDSGLMLHAYRLKVLLPGEKQPRIFRAPLPKRFKDILKLRTG